jgi:hypothetical protein
MHRFGRLAAVFSLALSVILVAQDATPRGRKYKAPPPTSRVEVTVLRRDDAKPIENAAVVFQLVGDKGNMELKTNEDGKAVIDVLPTGSKVVLQVLAKGYQTYGKDYSIDKPQMAVEVRLNRPGKQYSIYQDHPDAAKQDSGAGKDQPPVAGKDGTSKDSEKKDQPAESANQSGSKPDANQPHPQ